MRRCDRGRASCETMALALALMLLLAGCDGASKRDRTLRFGLAEPPRQLDPCFATDATSERINRLLFRRLVEFDSQGLPVPGIADWERRSPTHYRFHLGTTGRDFTDGTRLTAADVAATYAFLLDPLHRSPQRSRLTSIVRIDQPDADTVDFYLNAPDPLFPASLSYGIVPAHAIATRCVMTQPIGSGSFRVLDWPRPGLLRLQRRADGQIVELIAVKDPNVRVMKLLRGEIHMLQNDLAPELVSFLSGRDGVRVETRPGSNFSYLGFNLEDPATGKRQVRQAIAHTLDRNALLHFLFQDRGRLAEAIFPPDHWVGTHALKPYAHRPELARALLAEVGFGPQRPLRLTLKTSSDPFRLRVATAIQSQLAAAGIELTIRSYDWGTFFGDVREGRFQLYGLSWVGIQTPDIFRYAFHRDAIPPNGANRGRFRHPEVDRLIDTASREPELAVQSRLYRELQSVLHDELPYLPLWYEAQCLVTRTEVRDYRLAADGNYTGLETVWLERSSGENGMAEGAGANRTHSAANVH